MARQTKDDKVAVQLKHAAEEAEIDQQLKQMRDEAETAKVRFRLQKNFLYWFLKKMFCASFVGPPHPNANSPKMGYPLRMDAAHFSEPCVWTKASETLVQF